MDITTIKAREGAYLTQNAALEDEGQRIFVREISGFGIIAENWREAGQSEKDEWEAAHPMEEGIND